MRSTIAYALGDVVFRAGYVRGEEIGRIPDRCFVILRMFETWKSIYFEKSNAVFLFDEETRSTEMYRQSFLIQINSRSSYIDLMTFRS